MSDPLVSLRPGTVLLDALETLVTNGTLTVQVDTTKFGLLGSKAKELTIIKAYRPVVHQANTTTVTAKVNPNRKGYATPRRATPRRLGCPKHSSPFEPLSASSF